MALKRYSKLGFVVSGHLAAYALLAKPTASGDAAATFWLGALSALLLAVTLFYELSVPAGGE
jgi:hypothetical protein